MKKIVICALVILFFSCTENKDLSHTETAKIVIESFYNKDNSTMKNYTTADGYSGLMMIQNMVPDEDKDVNVEILDEAVENDTAWVKYNTSYDKKPGTFKLIKENGEWKVTNKEPREKGPF